MKKPRREGTHGNTDDSKAEESGRRGAAEEVRADKHTTWHLSRQKKCGTTIGHLFKPPPPPDDAEPKMVIAGAAEGVRGMFHSKKNVTTH